ncbi:hypothetical protein F5B20DRAFT_581732 [Whalleya microplaca]|nr:hypothetical protein F5B20DRAFT_581732 [Whalleya microplaca]
MSTMCPFARANERTASGQLDILSKSNPPFCTPVNSLEGLTTLWLRQMLWGFLGPIWASQASTSNLQEGLVDQYMPNASGRPPNIFAITLEDDIDLGVETPVMPKAIFLFQKVWMTISRPPSSNEAPAAILDPRWICRPIPVPNTGGGIPHWWLGMVDDGQYAPTTSPGAQHNAFRKFGSSGADAITSEVDGLTSPFSIIVTQAVNDPVDEWSPAAFQVALDVVVSRPELI